jgi:hypothetical protein
MSSKDSVLISEFTYNHVKDRIEAIPVGSRQFKGKQKEVMVYEVVSMNPAGQTTPATQKTDKPILTEDVQSPNEHTEDLSTNEIPNPQLSEPLQVQELE